MIEEALVKLICQSLAAIQDRIYPAVLPAGSQLPAIVYQMIASVDEPEMDGTDTARQIVIQATCLDTSYSDAKTIAADLWTALKDIKGTYENVDIQGIFKEDESDIPDISAQNEKINMHGRRMDLKIFFAE